MNWARGKGIADGASLRDPGLPAARTIRWMQSRESAFAMERTRFSARVVVRRRFLADCVNWFGRLAVGASVAGVAIVLAAKANWVAPPNEWLPIVLGGSAAIGACALAWRSRWSEVRAARELDRVLGLQDTLSSALELRAGAREQERPFVEELGRRAELFAAEARTNRVAPLRWGSSWLVFPLLALLGVAMFVWLPERSEVARVQAQKRERERQDAVAEIRSVAEAVKPKATEAEAPKSNKQLEEQLAAIEEELRAGALTPHDARLRSAQALEEQAQQTERQAREKQQSIEQAKRALAKAAARSHDPAPGADRVASAIRRGDFERAAEELDRLARDPAAAPEDKQRAAEELDKIAQGLQEQSAGEQQPSQEPASRQQELSDAAKRAADELRKAADQKAPQGGDARQPNPTEEKQGNPPSEPSADQPKGESKDPAAGDSKQEPKNPGSQPGNQPSSKPESSKQPASGGKDQPSPGKQTAEEKKGTEKPQTSPGEKKQEGADKQQPAESGKQDAQNQPAPGSGVNEKQQQPGNAPSQQPPGAGQPQRPELQPPSNAGNQRSDTTQDTKDKSKQTGPQQSPSSSPPSAPSPQEKSGAQPSSSPDGKQGAGNDKQPQDSGKSEGGSDQPSPSQQGSEGKNSSPQQSAPNQTERLADQLRSLSRDQSAAERERDTARGMRDKAQQMLENASPEERAKLQDLARRLGNSDRPSGAPATPWRGPTQTFDARPDESSKPIDSDKPAERTIAEWLSEPKPGGKGPGGVVPADSLKRASESAQEAIENQAIPPQHADLVRRVFKRYAETAQSPAKTVPGSPK